MATKKLKAGNVPNLRFKDFEGEWVERKLSEVTKKINSGKTPLGGESAYTNQGIPFIRSQNVNNNSLEIARVAFISNEMNEQMKNSVVNANDILLNITGASLGRSCVVPKDFTEGNVNQHVCIIRFNQEYNPRFVQPIFSSAKGQAIFVALQTGSGREGLTFESIKGIKLKFPSKTEQDKIANFVSLLEDRIATQIKIIKELETLIKGLREKLFSQQLKFKADMEQDFAKWKKKKLGDFALLQRGFDLPVTEIKHGNYPVVFSNGILKYHNEFKVKGPGVVTGRSGTIGNLTYVEQDYWPHNTALWVKDFYNNNPKFVYYFFLQYNLERFATGSGVPTLNRNDIHIQEECMPTSEVEQIKISNFLTAFDERIKLERRLLQIFELQKKYLLKNMFI